MPGPPMMGPPQGLACPMPMAPMGISPLMSPLTQGPVHSGPSIPPLAAPMQSEPEPSVPSEPSRQSLLPGFGLPIGEIGALQKIKAPKKKSRFDQPFSPTTALKTKFGSQLKFSMPQIVKNEATDDSSEDFSESDVGLKTKKASTSEHLPEATSTTDLVRNEESDSTVSSATSTTPTPSPTPTSEVTYPESIPPGKQHLDFL